MNSWLQGVWEGQVHTAIFRMDHQQGPTVQHTELCSMLGDSLAEWGVLGGEWIHVNEWLSPFALHLKRPQRC